MPIKLQQSLDLGATEAKRFLASNFCSATILDVPRVERRTVGQCYDNTREKIKTAGGKAVAGWILTWLPNHFIEALHHAVWQDQNGKLKDVTEEAFPLMSSQPNYFIVDETIKIDPVFDPGIPSIFMQLDDKKETSDYIRNTIRRMEIKKEINSLYAASLAASGPIINPRVTARAILLKQHLDAIDMRRWDYINIINAGNYR